MCLICGRYLQYGQLGNSFSLRAGLHSPMQTFWGMSNLTGSWAQLFGPVGIRNAAPHSSLQVGSLPFHMYFCFFERQFLSICIQKLNTWDLSATMFSIYMKKVGL